MRKFLHKTTVFSFGCIFLVVTINFLVDPAKIFDRGSYEDKIIDIILKNENVKNISNYNERILQKKWIDKLEVRPDIVVLGSSRTLLINSSYFHNKNLINNSVSGASIEDLIAIFNMYKLKNVLPKKLILGIDPWLFNENNKQERWLSLQSEYNAYFGNEEKNSSMLFYSKLKQLFSLSYFQSSIKNLDHYFLTQDPTPTKTSFNKTNTKRVDGSITYNEKYRGASSEAIKAKAIKYISDDLYSIENFGNISPQLFNQFEMLCSDILKNDIELSFFMAPYHPIVYDKIKQDYQIVLNVEDKVLEFATVKNIKCFGSFNANKQGVNNDDFYDGMHLKEAGIRKIFSP
jgi:hypothetical protein